MKLKVIRYKNYGCTMTGGGDSESWEHKFYFSFYELINGEIIGLDLHENFQDGKLVFIEHTFSYTKTKLKNGEIINYKFGNAKAIDKNEMSKEFFEWFESLPPAIDVIDNFAPYDHEEKCVKEFYLKHIKPIKNIKTDTTEV